MQDKFTRQAANALKLAKTTAQSCKSFIYWHRAYSGRSAKGKRGTRAGFWKNLM